MISAVVGSAGIFACTGGGGALSEGMSTWDPAPTSLERAENTRESAPRVREVAPPVREATSASSESGPGAQGGGSSPGALDCSGTYKCVKAGDDDVDELKLRIVGGVCTAPTDDKTAFVLASDGSILLSGRKIGSWRAISGGFSATTDDGDITCVKAPEGASGRGSGEDTNVVSVPAGRAAGS